MVIIQETQQHVHLQKSRTTLVQKTLLVFLEINTNWFNSSYVLILS